jgi:superfamily II DNA or RNA helicase
MRDFFREKGLRAASVHSGEHSDPRAKSLEDLSAGLLDVICAVDVFNEGLDLPELDTVLMLRPTESQVLWLQQFGRGLRRGDNPDKELKVIDYIGNHRTFLQKPQTLFQLEPGDRHVMRILDQLQRDGRVEIAPGCFVTYDLQAIDILRGLLRVGRVHEALDRYYADFVERNDARPMAAEALHDGFNPRAVRREHGSWLRWVESKGGLTRDQARVRGHHEGLLNAVEATDMTRSYKMLVLLGMLNADRLPGTMTVEEMAVAVLDLANRNPRLMADLGPAEATTNR